MINYARTPVLLLTLGLTFLGLATPGIADKPATSNSPIVVACVGDSLTAEGSRPGQGLAYPDQLQGLLGSGYKVENFGHGGGTALKKGDFTYWKKKEYPLALASKPNIVIIMLGTNDSKPQNWVYGDQYVADYRDLIKSFQALDTHPRIYLCRVPTVVEPNKYKISEQVSVTIRQRIDELGKELGLTVIPMDQAYGGDLSVLGTDRVHGDARGALELAQTAAKVLTTKEAAPTPAAL
jgi:lysophospholipase L1-like esterase